MLKLQDIQSWMPCVESSIMLMSIRLPRKQGGVEELLTFWTSLLRKWESEVAGLLKCSTVHDSKGAVDFESKTSVSQAVPDAM